MPAIFYLVAQCARDPGILYTTLAPLSTHLLNHRRPALGSNDLPSIGSQARRRLGFGFEDRRWEVLRSSNPDRIISLIFEETPTSSKKSLPSSSIRSSAPKTEDRRSREGSGGGLGRALAGVSVSVSASVSVLVSVFVFVSVSVFSFVVGVVALFVLVIIVVLGGEETGRVANSREDPKGGFLNGVLLRTFLIVYGRSLSFVT